MLLFSFIDEKTDAGRLNDFPKVKEDFSTVLLGSKDCILISIPF